MAIPKSPSLRVRLRHLRGAGLTHQALGLDFRASDTLEVLRGLAEAAVDGFPGQFAIEEIEEAPAEPVAGRE